jgi:hypothetical protein
MQTTGNLDGFGIQASRLGLGRRERAARRDRLDQASPEQLAEALENTRREMYELEQQLTRRIERLQHEIERLD